MSKATVIKLFAGSIIAVIAGALLTFAAVWLAFANGVFEMSGPDVVGIASTPFAWAMIALMIVGVVAIIAGSISGLVSWIGALLNTAALADKGWFVMLLLLGLFSFGFIAMIVYVIAGPDGTVEARSRAIHAPV